MWQKFHQQCIAQQINSQASNWNTGNILLIEGTRSYPTIQKFCRDKSRITSLVAWLVLHPAQAPDLRESWRWLDGAGWGWWRSMLRCAPGFYTIAAGAITLGRAREQRAAQESRFELWPLEATCQPSPSPHRGILTLIRSMQYIQVEGKMKIQLFPVITLFLPSESVSASLSSK